MRIVFNPYAYVVVIQRLGGVRFQVVLIFRNRRIYY